LKPELVCLLPQPIHGWHANFYGAEVGVVCLNAQEAHNVVISALHHWMVEGKANHLGRNFFSVV